MTDLSVETEATPAELTRGKYALRLYVAGNTSQSRLAIERAKAFCETHLKGCHELTIVDLYQQPEVLQDEQIVAVPLLVKKSPPPVRQFIGDLWDTNRILLGLDLYRVLVERMNEGAAVVSAQNVVLYCNRRFAELFKTPLDRVAGLDIASFIAPSARATLHALLEAGRAGRGSGEITGWTADGAAVPLLLTCNALPVGSGTEVSIVVTDLSERKRVDAALGQERSYLKTLVQTIPDLIWLKDPEGVYLACNRRFERFLGASEAEIVGKTDYDFMDRELADFFREKDQAAMAAGQPRTNEETITFADDGHQELLETIKTPMFDTDGRLIGVLGVARDVTAARQTEAALRKSEWQYRLLAENATEGIFWLDPNGGFKYVSPAFSNLFGYPPEQFLADPTLMARILHPEDQSAYQAHFEQSAVLDEEELEFRITRRDGEVRWISHQCRPIFDEAGHYLGRRGVHRDITERKTVEQQLDRHRHHLEERVAERTAELAAARDAAEAANRAKSAFLANMSHEIRTPLNAILGLTYLLRQSGATPAQAERLNRIATAGRHLLTILNDVLDLSKIEAGKLVLEESDFAVGALLDQVRSLIADAAREKGLTVEIDVAAVPPWLRGDATRLRQALLNYAGNAVKFTERGTITLCARLVEEGEAGLLVRFKVRDSGIGLTAEQAGRIFAAFEQADASTTRQHGGTGLGLAIARRLAELMGGAVGVESQPGAGSTFWFTARQQRGQARAVAAPTLDAAEVERELSRRGAGVRLLLAEDNPINQEVALELLRGAGFAVDLAANGAEAVERARRTAYALILMDVQMPVLDGLAATVEIRRIPGREATPILAMTANAFADDRARCLAAGMNDHVAKPVDPDALYATLLKWLPELAPPGRSDPSAG